LKENQTMKRILRASLTMLVPALGLSALTFADPGRDIFKARCAPCHGATGAGDTTMGKNLKVRDLGSAEVQNQSDDELATIISSGKGKMPAYGSKLTKEQIAEVVRFIRTLKK
jgi:cytochrome c6